MQDILAGLNEAQREVVQTVYGPVLVLAGAGSGKTRALTHRIAYMISEHMAAPQDILAVTFTNKAAKEMKERVVHLVGDNRFVPRTIGTFHGLGARLLREMAGYHSRSQNFLIVDARDSEKLIKQAIRDCHLHIREWNPRMVKNKISNAKNNWRGVSDAKAMAHGSLEEVLVEVFARYEELLKKNDAYDFDDLLRVPTALLAEHEQLRQGYRARWKFLSIDEYQDTNPLQDRLVRLLTNADKNICVVGDDYQAIYSWRGATVDHILQFETAYPGCKTIYLTQNYRSTETILEAANNVIAPNVGQKHKTLWTERQGGEKVGVSMLVSDRYEASFVRQMIDEHQQAGGKFRDCAVLYRTNAQSRLFEEEFLRHRMPYTIVGGFRFYDRREVKDGLAFLHWWANPNSRLALDRLSEAMLEGVGPKTIDRWEARAAESHMSLRSLIEMESVKRVQLQKLARAYTTAQMKEFPQVSDLLRHLLTYSGYLDCLARDADGEERSENIEELLGVASAYTELEQFLEDAALLSDADTYEGESDRTACMTLHAAKGLEFPVVFLVGCEEGLLPHINSFDTTANIEEERRLLYVGMTRAKVRLHISYALQRYAGGQMTPQMPSRFLAQLPESAATEGDQGMPHDELPLLEYDLPRFNIT